MLAALNNVEQMLFARREITKFPANVPLDTQEMLGLHVIQVSLLNIRSEEIKSAHLKNWSLIENPQFLSNPRETWRKLLTRKVIIFPSFMRIGQKL